MSEFKILGEFVTHCSRCKLDLNHRITLMDGDQPKRVLCLTCHSEHSYRKPGGSSSRSPSTPRIASNKEILEVRQNHEERDWKLKLTDKSKTPTPYSASGSYETDAHVYHPTFGLGLVVGFVDGDKVQMYFEEAGIKLLKGKKKQPASESESHGALIWR